MLAGQRVNSSMQLMCLCAAEKVLGKPVAPEKPDFNKIAVVDFFRRLVCVCNVRLCNIVAIVLCIPNRARHQFSMPTPFLDLHMMLLSHSQMKGLVL